MVLNGLQMDCIYVTHTSGGGAAMPCAYPSGATWVSVFGSRTCGWWSWESSRPPCD